MNTNQTLNEENYKPLIVLLVVVFAFWLLLIFILSLLIKDWTLRSQFGGMSGAISSLFSGLAFAGVIFAIYLQKKELSLQRQELKDTRIELARTAIAQEKSEKALNKQVLLQNLSARLTSLNILINYNTDKAERVKHSQERLYHTLLNDNERYSIEIESLLSEIRNISKE